MGLRTLESIQAFYNEVAGWEYGDDSCQDALWRDGALSALRYVLKLSDEERLQKTLAAVNGAGNYRSHGDDALDTENYGYETTLLWCLNRIVRQYPISMEEIQSDPVGCDHEFEWNGESDADGCYVYVCEKCGYRVS